MDWLLHPVATYAFIAVSAGLNLWLFITLKIESAQSGAAAERRASELKTAVEAAVAEMRERLARLEREAAQDREAARERDLAPVPAASTPELPLGDLNLTRRSQALRLARRGESREKIAAALGIPLNEVDLLLKVQEILTGTL